MGTFKKRIASQDEKRLNHRKGESVDSNKKLIWALLVIDLVIWFVWVPHQASDKKIPTNGGSIITASRRNDSL